MLHDSVSCHIILTSSYSANCILLLVVYDNMRKNNGLARKLTLLWSSEDACSFIQSQEASVISPCSNFLNVQMLIGSRQSQAWQFHLVCTFNLTFCSTGRARSTFKLNCIVLAVDLLGNIKNREEILGNAGVTEHECYRHALLPPSHLTRL